MVSLKNKSKGFTIVELLIVIVVIGILATLVIVTFTGIQQKGRNSQRQTDINAVASHVEAYYADKGYYPTVANLNDQTFREDNLKGLDPEALKDPKATGGNIASGNATSTQYGYAVTPATCDNTDGNECTGFELQALLEGKTAPDNLYSKKSN